MGVPEDRLKCIECGENVLRAKALSAGPLWRFLVGRTRLDSDSYRLTSRFCGRCRLRVLRYQPTKFSIVSGSRTPEHAMSEEDNAAVHASPHAAKAAEPCAGDCLPGPSRNCENSSLPNEPNRTERSPQHAGEMEFSNASEIQVEEQHSYEMLEEVRAAYSEPLDLGVGRRRRTRRSGRNAATTVFMESMRLVTGGQWNCCVCGRKRVGGVGIRRVPRTARESFWLNHRVFVPDGSRSCSVHLRHGKFEDACSDQLVGRSILGGEVKIKELQKLIDRVTDSSLRNPVDLDSDELDYADYDLLFGVRKEDFDVLLACLKGMKNTIVRSIRSALGILLMKLRLGLSYRMLCFLFKIRQERKITKIIRSVAKHLEDNFVSKNLGFAHITRQEVLAKHQSEFVRKLYNVPEGKLVLILDGTYLWTEKSGDHDMQRKTYCSHKGRNLLKPMMVGSPTGYILEGAGMYFSDGQHNDASILKHMLQDENGIKTILEPGDVFVLDRGFRDAADVLRSKGFVVKLPAHRKNPKHQFTDKEANDTRLVTMVRWVIEAINGRVKNIFKFFDSVIPHQYYNDSSDKRLARLFRVACAIINQFHPPLFQDAAKHDMYLEEVVKRQALTNTLKEEVEVEGLDKPLRRTGKWQSMSGRGLEGFPQLSLDDLERLTLGQYQIKNARAYVDEHLRLDPDFKVYVHEDRPGLLRLKLRSRYCKSGRHTLWIEYGKEDGKDEPTVTRYYCRCRSGARTLGCCSHVASVLWFLGFQRHEAPTYQPRTFGTGILEIIRQELQAPAERRPPTDAETQDPADRAPIRLRFQRHMNGRSTVWSVTSCVSSLPSPHSG